MTFDSHHVEGQFHLSELQQRQGKNGEWVAKVLQRADHIARGLCRDCNAKAKPGTHSCERHLRFAVERKRRWRIERGLQKKRSEEAY